MNPFSLPPVLPSQFPNPYGSSAMNETLTLSVPNPLRWLDAIPPDLRMLLGLAVAGVTFYAWSNNLTLRDLLAKLRSFFSPEKPPVPPVPVPPSPILPDDPNDDVSIDDFSAQDVHLTIQGLAEWFAHHKDEKGLLTCISLGQHLYSSMLEELKPTPPKAKPRSSGPTPVSAQAAPTA